MFSDTRPAHIVDIVGQTSWTSDTCQGTEAFVRIETLNEEVSGLEVNIE